MPVDERIIPDGVLDTLDWFACDDDSPPPDTFMVSAAVGYGLLRPGAIGWVLQLLRLGEGGEARRLRRLLSRVWITLKGRGILYSWAEQQASQPTPPDSDEPLAATPRPAKRRRKDARQTARNKWLFNLYQRTNPQLTLAEIRRRLEGVWQKKGWEPITSDRGISKAVRQHCEANAIQFESRRS